MKRHTVESSVCPGLVVAGLRGGSGKTIFSVGLVSLLRKMNFCVAPFKKGPDYIDAGWLAMAAGQPCYNLDVFLLGPEAVLSSYQKNSKRANFSIIEGNRGLYDCISLKEDTSTAALAKLLKLPVILCADVSKTTRTMAAIISGIINFDTNVNIIGVILNRVAGIRHQRILTKSIERYCGIEVLGAIPKLLESPFPERHMGLVPTSEYKWAKNSIKFISSMARKYINLSELFNILKKNGFSCLSNRNFSLENIKVTNNNKNYFIENQLDYYAYISIKSKKKIKVNKPIVGIMLDSAFQFYYPENLEALERAGAKLVFISPIEDNYMPDVDAIYIGGGFPETHANRLDRNIYIRNKIKELAEAGLPIYAECGGLIYLGEKLLIGENQFNMSGVLPATFKIWKKPQGHGYTIVRVVKNNPYYPINSELRGHEFHYSSLHEWRGNNKKFAFLIKKGSGFLDNYDGVFYKKVMATYTHIHALGTKDWAKALIKNALEFKKGSCN